MLAIMNHLEITLTRQGTATPYIIVPKNVTTSLYSFLSEDGVICPKPEALGSQEDCKIEIHQNEMTNVEQAIDAFLGQRGVGTKEAVVKATNVKPESLGITWQFSDEEFHQGDVMLANRQSLAEEVKRQKEARLADNRAHR
ncbi:MAG TPA: hypothetical protein VL486_16070 [Verrucomicrobiae bacterium]|nr:hypothetical protein [Verrucomicrobiae bacterium]